jgi:hypothetical protein
VRNRTPPDTRALVRRIAGFFESTLVPASVSTRRKSAFYPSVPAAKNSVPDSDFRDRFDDWMGGWQFGPFQQALRGFFVLFQASAVAI